MIPSRSWDSWENKGRGIAIFRSSDHLPLAPFQARPHTSIIQYEEIQNDASFSLDSIERICFQFLPEEALHREAHLRSILRLLLHAYRHRIPVYLSTDAAIDDFAHDKLPFGSWERLDEALRLMQQEQFWFLVQQCSYVVPTPNTPFSRDQVPLTPIERKLAEELDRQKILYTAQAAVGNYVADFLLELDGRTKIVVEADGRAFHDPDKDADRDAGLRKLGIHAVLHFSGSEIVHSPKRCVDQIRTAICAAPASPIPPLPWALSPEQQPCMIPSSGTIMTLAPAGSGKTRVLACRVLEAARSGTKPFRILCAVFNRDAKDVMCERIQREAGLRDTKIATLHSVGYEIVRTDGGPCIGFKVANDRQVRDAYINGIQKVYENGFVKGPILDGFLAAASAYKRALRSPQNVDFVDENYDIGRLPDVIEEADKYLAEKKLLTFDDQVFLAVQHLLSQRAARWKHQNRFDFILVDEFQDLTPMQFLLMRILAMPQDNLFVVGDDDQMIYSFTGADPRNMRLFENTFQTSVKHTLGENYRCAPTIVRNSANLISHNLQRYRKDIRPFDPERTEAEDSFRLVSESSTIDELKAITETIRRWTKAGAAYQDIAILVRVRILAGLAHMHLSQEGIPVEEIEDVRFFDSPIGQVFGVYLALANNPEAVARDDLASALRTPTLYLRNDTIHQAAAGGWKHLENLDWTADNRQRECLEKFVDKIRTLHIYAVDPAHSSLEILVFLASYIGLRAYFEGKDRQAGNADTMTGEEFLDILKDMAVERPVFREFAQHYRNQQTLERAKKGGPRESREDCVRLRTIHKCKGDEFPNVVLFHVTEGVLPHKLAIEADGLDAMEEERRVFYVGITRAKERVLISTERGKESRFLQEIKEPRQQQTTRIEVEIGTPEGQDRRTASSLFSRIMIFFREIYTRVT